jgi:membrane-associated phospholipid phosphatase
VTAETRVLQRRPADQGTTAGAPILPVGAWREGGLPRAARSRQGALAAAGVVTALAAVGVWFTWRMFVTTVAGQRVDDMAWDGAAHGQGRLWAMAEPVLDVVSVSFVVAGMVAAVAMAAMRRRWFLTVQVVVLVGGANVTTQVLKKVVLDRPDLLDGWNGANTLPSGHTTVAASVSAAMLMAAPRAWRPVVALLGAAYTAATGVSTLVGQWHRPSDVVAALLVVLAWGALMCAVTGGSALDLPRHPGDSLASPGSSVLAGLLLVAGVVGGLAAVGALAGLTGAGWALPAAPDLTAYAAGTLAVLATTAVVFAVLLLVRQATARPRDAERGTGAEFGAPRTAAPR